MDSRGTARIDDPATTVERSHPRSIDVLAASRKERYQLLTSLVVPRPIAWLSTRSASGEANLAPFSYFAALSHTPMLVAVSIGHRRDRPKDSLVNIRDTGDFCVNVVTDRQLEAMNLTSARHPPEADEFEAAGLGRAEAVSVDAPYVADCPAVFECRLFREVELDGARNTLVIGEVVRVHLAEELLVEPGTLAVEPESLRPIGRLSGSRYARLGEVVEMERPEVE